MSKTLLISTFAVAIVIALSTDIAYSQGRPHGGGGGRPAGAGGGNPNSMDGNSRGRSDDMFGRSEDRRMSNRVDRNSPAAERRSNALRNAPDDNELNRYRGISKKLGTTPEELRARYIAESTLNPDLKFGQFVSANVVADNLNARYPGVTTAAILSRMADGDSLGEALRALRVDGDTAKRAEKEAKRQVKESTHKV